ncbi:hypothetical protein LCGC14_1839770, partial [marine sediment metagenome]
LKKLVKENIINEVRREKIVRGEPKLIYEVLILKFYKSQIRVKCQV